MSKQESIAVATAKFDETMVMPRAKMVEARDHAERKYKLDKNKAEYSSALGAAALALEASFEQAFNAYNEAVEAALREYELNYPTPEEAKEHRP